MEFDRRWDTGDDRDFKISCKAGEPVPIVTGQWWVGKDNNDENNLRGSGNFTMALTTGCEELSFAGAYTLAASALSAVTVAGLYL